MEAGLSPTSWQAPRMVNTRRVETTPGWCASWGIPSDCNVLEWCMWLGPRNVRGAQTNNVTPRYNGVCSVRSWHLGAWYS